VAIDFNSGPNSLFPRLGRLGKLLFSDHGAQAASLTINNDELGRFLAADMDLSAGFAASRESRIRSLASADLAGCQQIATPVLLRMVAADQPTRAGSVPEAMVEVVRQMKAGGVTVKAATVGVSTAAFSGVTGSQVLLVSTKRGDGRDQELLVAEAAQVRCVGDSRTGGAPVGGERYQFFGVAAGSSTAADYDWPLGSSGRKQFTGASALISYPSGQNKLVNSGFDGPWASVTPPSWTKSGTIIQETGTVYGAGTSAVKVAIGDTPILTQVFNDGTAGTAFQPSPLQSLGFCLFARALTSIPTAGVLRVELWSTAGAVNDDTGSPAKVDFALSSNLPVADTWYPLTGVIRTPAILPAGLSVRVKVSTASDVAFFYDHLALTPLTQAYNGGPGLAAFAGDVAPLLGDGFTVTPTNNRGGATYGATFNTLFDRLFGMRNLNAETGLLLPTAGSPTIPDTLITS
jgi:hypothetical protein